MNKTSRKCGKCKLSFVPALITNGIVQYFSNKCWCFSCHPVPDQGQIATERELLIHLQIIKQNKLEQAKKDKEDRKIARRKHKLKKHYKPSRTIIKYVSENKTESIKEIDAVIEETKIVIPVEPPSEILLKKKYISPAITPYEYEIKAKKCCKCLRSFPTTGEYFMLGVKGKKKKVIVGVYCKDCTSKSNEDAKRLAVEYKGGECSKCGYNKCISALDFHHINPAEKDYPITRMRIFDDLMRAELDKCILLCANCHREEHYRLRGENKRARKEKFAKAQLNP